MQDTFIEQLIKRELTAADRIKRLGLIFFAVAVFTFSMAIVPGFGMIITVVVGIGIYFLISRLKREYEYTFTNGELDIDVIYNRSSRKRLFSAQVRDFEIMAHADDEAHKNSFASATDKLDCSTGVITERSYKFLANYKGKRYAITLEPNDELLKAMVKILTRRKFHPKK